MEFQNKMNDQEDIEMYKTKIYLCYFETFRYLTEHVKMFEYDKYYNKLYTPKSFYLTFLYVEQFDKRDGLIEYIKENYTKEEIKERLNFKIENY